MKVSERRQNRLQSRSLFGIIACMLNEEREIYHGIRYIGVNLAR